MAFPVIRIHSGTGSDTAASGAGPTTAITGTSAATSGDGLTVTLDGSPDLSGVATDGSAVIYVANATAGARNFAKITAADNTAKTVTVSEAFAFSLSGQTWAIGGTRATINGATSTRLYNNNGAAGDAMPGWTLRMLSGHVEAIAQIVLRRSGNRDSGYIAIEGEPGAATRPEITTNNAGGAINPAGNGYFRIRGFNLKKSGSSGAPAIGSGVRMILKDLRVLPNSGVVFANGFNLTFGGNAAIEDCYIEGTSGSAIVINGESPIVRNNHINGCGVGIEVSLSSPRNVSLAGNVVHSCTSHGVAFSSTADNEYVTPPQIINNTIHGNGGDGINITSTSAQRAILSRLQIKSNHLTGNTGRGLNFSGSGVTDELLNILSAEVHNNNFGTGATVNSGGDCNLTLTLTGSNNVNLDPVYTDAANGDFSIGTATAELGHPLEAIGSGAVAGNRSYVAVGAIQPQGSGGGGGFYASQSAKMI